MINVICDNCGTIGFRFLGKISTVITHPAYRPGATPYRCQICGSRLRIAGIQEFNKRIMEGADTRA